MQMFVIRKYYQDEIFVLSLLSQTNPQIKKQIFLFEVS